MSFGRNFSWFHGRFVWLIAVVTSIGLLVTSSPGALAASNNRPVATGMATYYVAPNGNDANVGSFARPFLTISRARDVVRARASGMTGNITVYVRGGTYRLTRPLTFGAQDSGTHGFSVRYVAYPNERPVISGGVPIRGWTLHDRTKNIWQAPVGSLATRTLYVNGVKGQIARSAEKEIPFEKGDSGFSTSATSISKWAHLDQVELVGHNMQKFYVCRVASVSGGDVSVAQPCWDNSQKSDPPFDGVNWVQNAYELLDKPGEWYLDSTAKILYYIPRKGESLSSANVIAGGLQTLVQGKSVSNITFSGLAFEYTGWNLPSTSVGYVGLQQGDHPLGAWNGDDGEEMVPPAVNFVGSHKLVIQRSTFANLAGVGVAISGGGQNVVIAANRFQGIGNNAINLGDFTHEEPEAAQQDRGMVIANNYITKIGLDYPNSAGIWAGYVADVQITHNELFQLPQKGIAVGWGWGTDSYASGNKIMYNYVHEFTMVLEDSGGIYTLSAQPKTEIAYNHIDHDVNGYNCLYPDEGSAFTNWHHNVCERTDEWLHLWTDSIHDNTVQFNFADTTKEENAGTDNNVSQNTFITNGAWPAAAQKIKASAGIQPAYKFVKTNPIPR